jgi:alpha-L-fucosidase
MPSALQPLHPTASQLRWQRHHRLALFFHFGVNTFNGVEWSDGRLPAGSFNPAALDCPQWVDAAREAGAAHVILTAKHHDGFCLWPSATTDYSVRSSPWRNGNGDVVAELATACREAGIGLGLYLSPWDRHDPDWEHDHADYDARYVAQLAELCTGYGPLVEVWFDGAGSERHPYDWPAIMAVVRQHQPEAMVFNMGEPTIRWVGNEDGVASDPCWYTVDAAQRSMFDGGHDDLFGGAHYLPPECDVSIRDGWFWHPHEAATLKSQRHLEAIWYRSIGLGANLLLNVPPNRDGLLDEADRERLVGLGRMIRDRFANPIEAEVSVEDGGLMATFPGFVEIDHLWLEEAIADGQRVRGHRIVDAETGDVIVDGVRTIGSQRVHVFPTRTVRQIRIEVNDPEARLDAVRGFRTGVEHMPTIASGFSPE